MNNAERVVLITGCSSGIGAALARDILARGWTVVATARRPESLHALGEAGADCQRCDVTSDADVRALYAHIGERYGRLDRLINNAGYGAMGPLAEIPLAQVERQLATNVTGVLRMIQGAVGLMKETEGSVIANVGSISGVVPTPFSGAYCASKAAVHTLGEVLRLELAPFGIGVVTIQPGAVASEFGATAERELAGQHSLYAAYETHIRRRATASQEGAMPAEEFARRVFDELQGERPAAVLRLGPKSTFFSALAAGPRRVRDYVLASHFGLAGRDGEP